MAAPRIYTDQDLAPASTVELGEGPSRHLAGSLRLAAGAAVTLFNGRGGEYHGHIKAAGRRKVTVDVLEHDPVERESPLAIHLGVAVSRGDRFDWVVQKSTELGVAAITPLFTERTGVKLGGDRAAKKQRHWQQVAISACEQCGRNHVPTVENAEDIDDWLARVDSPCRLVLHHREAESVASVESAQAVTLLIGPEGGLTATELTAARNQQFRAIRLGPRVLRTETAPLAAIAVLQQQWGDLA